MWAERAVEHRLASAGGQPTQPWDGTSSPESKLCKRHLFMLEQLVRTKGNKIKKKDGPPEMLYLRELFASLPAPLREQITAQASDAPEPSVLSRWPKKTSALRIKLSVSCGTRARRARTCDTHGPLRKHATAHAFDLGPHDGLAFIPSTGR